MGLRKLGLKSWHVTLPRSYHVQGQQDLSLCASVVPQARLGFPEISRGAVYPYCGSLLLPLLAWGL